MIVSARISPENTELTGIINSKVGNDPEGKVNSGKDPVQISKTKRICSNRVNARHLVAVADGLNQSLGCTWKVNRSINSVGQRVAVYRRACIDVPPGDDSHVVDLVRNCPCGFGIVERREDTALEKEAMLDRIVQIVVKADDRSDVINLSATVVIAPG